MAKMRYRRLQVYLRPDQESALEALAKQTGRSKADLIRESVDGFLSDLPLEDDPAMRIISLGKSEKGDLAKRHDAYVGEAVRRKQRHA
ncbi:MAG TPA: hypothetical protein DCP08_02815 [Chloroflexi bacterium]|nr:hypothetical protein [Chloroflexota bacterium]